MTSGTKPSKNSAIAGSVALEYGLLVPALLLLTLGTMDVGRLMWTYTTLHRSVEAAARCAAINPSACGSASAVTSRAANEAWGLGLDPSTFTLQTASCGALVTANYNFSLLIPWIGGTRPDDQPNAITLTVSACYPL